VDGAFFVAHSVTTNRLIKDNHRGSERRLLRRARRISGKRMKLFQNADSNRVSVSGTVFFAEASGYALAVTNVRVGLGIVASLRSAAGGRACYAPSMNHGAGTSPALVA